MQFVCQISRQPSGQWRVQHRGRDIGDVEVSAPGRDEALEKMRGELRYRLEICPCTGELYDDKAIELIVKE